MMMEKMLKTYSEVKLDGNYIGHFYKNPLTKAFQYEYALFTAISDWFGYVECLSMNIESLKLYFSELPVKRSGGNKAGNSRTQKDIIDEVKELVNRDVTGHIVFPMMNVCAVEVRLVVLEDGTHEFVFSDGIYGCKLHLKYGKNGHPAHIVVKNLV